MRGMIIFVLLLIPVLLIGILLLALYPQSWMPRRLTGALSSIGLAPAEKKEAPSEEPKPKPFEPKQHPQARNHPIPEAPRVTIETLPSPPAAPEVRYRFPLASDIRLGTARSAIFALFGPPEATVTGADLGQLQERFIYMDKPTRRRTLISLINGNVTAVETVPQ